MVTTGFGSGPYALPDQDETGRGARSSAIERVLARFGEVARRAGAAHGLRGDDLDEVLQEVRIRLWRAGAGTAGALAKLETLTPSYVYRAAASAAIDLLRRRRARREARLDDEPEPAALSPSLGTTDDAVLAGETARAIDASLSELVPSRRAVVRMYLKGYDREEIAALLGWSEAKTRNLLYRGLDDLRRRLTARGIHP
jgi:RNA polymerase sigma-70 factor (ECF subfamily)